MQYSKNIDYLLASILYLGVHSFCWARSPHSMAAELGLNENRLEKVFNSFPGIWKSVRISEKGQHYYALQARYAQKEGGDTADPEETAYIQPLDNERVELLTNFVVRMAEEERNERRGRSTNILAVSAAVIAALAAVVSALVG